MNISKELYTCICCGYKTLYDDTGYNICVLCGWEDDPLNWDNPRNSGGPNGKDNLYKQQKAIIRHGFPYTWKEFRDEEGYGDDFEIDKHWEPFQENYHDIRNNQPKSRHPWLWMLGSFGYKEYEKEQMENRKKTNDSL